MHSFNSIPRICLVISGLLLAFLATSCGSGSSAKATKSSPTAAPSVTAAPTGITPVRAITDADAERLTLRAAEFGAAYAGYETAKSTGALTVEDIPDGACGADVKATVTRLHVERGYNTDWVRPDAAASDADLSVGSFVEIYPDADAAHEKL